MGLRDDQGAEDARADLELATKSCKRIISDNIRDISREVTLMKASQALRFLAVHFEGWGTFDITVLLKWKSGFVQRTTWELQFDQSDAFQELQVPAKVVQPAIPGCPAPPPPASETVEQVPVPPWEAENSDVFGVRGSIGLDSEDDVPMPPPAPPAEDTPGPPPELLRV